MMPIAESEAQQEQQQQPLLTSQPPSQLVRVHMELEGVVSPSHAPPSMEMTSAPPSSASAWGEPGAWQPSSSPTQRGPRRWNSSNRKSHAASRGSANASSMYALHLFMCTVHSCPLQPDSASPLFGGLAYRFIDC